jgi:hypothetical protein
VLQLCVIQLPGICIFVEAVKQLLFRLVRSDWWTRHVDSWFESAIFEFKFLLDCFIFQQILLVFERHWQLESAVCQLLRVFWFDSCLGIKESFELQHILLVLHFQFLKLSFGHVVVDYGSSDWRQVNAVSAECVWHVTKFLVDWRVISSFLQHVLSQLDIVGRVVAKVVSVTRFQVGDRWGCNQDFGPDLVLSRWVVDLDAFGLELVNVWLECAQLLLLISEFLLLLLDILLVLWMLVMHQLKRLLLTLGTSTRRWSLASNSCFGSLLDCLDTLLVTHLLGWGKPFLV